MNYTKVQQKLLACKEKLFYCPVLDNSAIMYYTGTWGVIILNVYHRLDPLSFAEYREAEKYIDWTATQVMTSFNCIRPMNRNGKPADTYEFKEASTGITLYVNPDCFKIFDFHAQYSHLCGTNQTGPLVVFEEDRRYHEVDWTNPKGFVFPERWNK